MPSLYIYFKPIFIALSVSVLNAACGGGTSGALNTGNTNSVVQAPANVDISVAENTVLVRNFSAAQSSDATNLGLDVNAINSVVFSISGGTDQEIFSIGQNTSNDYILFFNTAPDFELPEDSNKDNVYELEVKGESPSASATQSVRVTVTDIFDKLNALNDTGITLCGDYAFGGSTHSHNNITCIDPDPDGDPVPDKQDAQLGRDANATLSKAGAGVAGFDFTKLDSAGATLPLATGSWDCVKDNHTGLIWEKKGTSGARSSADSFAWLNTDPALNGGTNGDIGSSFTCDGYEDTVEKRCNTSAFVARVNQVGLCGAKDWRLPTVDELQGIMHYGAAAAPLLDIAYFNNIQSPYVFWSVSPSSVNTANAWAVDFSSGIVFEKAKSDRAYVRLVRGGR